MLRHFLDNASVQWSEVPHQKTQYLWGLRFSSAERNQESSKWYQRLSNAIIDHTKTTSSLKQTRCHKDWLKRNVGVWNLCYPKSSSKSQTAENQIAEEKQVMQLWRDGRRNRKSGWIRDQKGWATWGTAVGQKVWQSSTTNLLFLRRRLLQTMKRSKCNTSEQGSHFQLSSYQTILPI